MSRINDKSHIDEKSRTWTIVPAILRYYSLIVVLSNFAVRVKHGLYHVIL